MKIAGFHVGPKVTPTPTLMPAPEEEAARTSSSGKPPAPVSGQYVTPQQPTKWNDHDQYVQEVINDFLAGCRPSSVKVPIRGYGKTFVYMGKCYGVDPRLLVSISGIETEFGTTGNAEKIHNAYGWGPHMEFRDWTEGILVVTRGLYAGYTSKGLTTIPKIAGKYSPASAGNDESKWVKVVTDCYKKMGGTLYLP